MFKKAFHIKSKKVETSLIERFYYPKYGPGPVSYTHLRLCSVSLRKKINVIIPAGSVNIIVSRYFLNIISINATIIAALTENITISAEQMCIRDSFITALCFFIF